MTTNQMSTSHQIKRDWSEYLIDHEGHELTVFLTHMLAEGTTEADLICETCRRTVATETCETREVPN